MSKVSVKAFNVLSLFPCFGVFWIFLSYTAFLKLLYKKQSGSSAVELINIDIDLCNMLHQCDIENKKRAKISFVRSYSSCHMLRFFLMLYNETNKTRHNRFRYKMPDLNEMMKRDRKPVDSPPPGDKGEPCPPREPRAVTRRRLHSNVRSRHGSVRICSAAQTDYQIT